ncbi:phage tail protein [Gluconacetobacter takamatsuzukensis]|uniref:Tail fiber protein n=1 Tax=Gluconacetobacter takamatsuzukensis TaxID=1286190 RepID=A0A7W4PPN8_9PROT|nr:phage tail protein [Gluconacetobacter takamatsuzukensis]MBB2205630.1 tail fiber protein [Gluconacetobacter takamatsuzukensis]
MAYSAARFAWPNCFSVDAAGVPRAGARLFFYQTGTTTLLATYADAALTVANANPVVADASGQFGNIFLGAGMAYAVVLCDAAGNQIWTMDPVGEAGSAAVPVGAIVDYAGAAAPAGWLLCYGQNVSRTVYAALFGVVGTLYGAGDGATSFGLPDLRGRATFGVDNMGGAAANLVTMAGSNVNGVQLGAVGGSQAAPAHAHDVTDPGHTHALTDPGHGHGPNHGSGFVVPQGSGGEMDAVFAGGGDVEEKATARTATATTGLTAASTVTGVTIAAAGSGDSQNMPPAMMLNRIIYAGVGG